MKIVSYQTESGDSWGILRHDCVVPMNQVWSNSRLALIDGIESIAKESSKVETRIPLESIKKWYPPIRQPNKILCVGINYLSHIKEAGRTQASKPSFFIRYADSFVGEGDSVQRPFVSEDLDYEAELAIVIGKSGRYVKPEDSNDYVFGYMCMAENSVRDYQKHSTQVTAGKNFYRSGAVGPWITTRDEIEDISSNNITGRLNGEIVQSARFSDMVFSIPELIAYASTFTELSPGDVIATGTPEGVGFKKNPPVFLKPGDLFEVDISGVGCLKNGVIDELLESVNE